jgi:ribose transport system permease protein
MFNRRKAPVGIAAGDGTVTTLRPSVVGRRINIRDVSILIVVLVVSAVLAVTTSSFLTTANFSAVAIGLVTDGVIAIAMTMVLITGGFDLSVGSVLALSGMIVAGLLHGGMSIPPAVLITLAASALVGLINGLIISKVGVNPLITTLGMMGIASSVTLVLSGGYPVSNLPKPFLYLGQGYLLGIPVSVVLLLVMVLIADALLRRAQWLRQIYYVGGNERAALLSGIPVDRIRIIVYVFCALMAGVAGIIATSRLASAFPLAGKGTELRVISACVIGGCSLSGGEGSVIGSLLGVTLMAIINNGLVLLNVSIYWQGIVSGIILIGAVTFDMLSRRAQNR